MYNNLKNSLCFRLFSSALNVMFANELTLKAKNYYRIVLQSGLSMIEMLGVLAIIAVLSVGGIAGYSKAMQKFKINKAVSEYSYMLTGVLEYMDSLKELSKGTSHVMLADFFVSANIVPSSWEKRVVRNNIVVLIDSYGNEISPYADYGTKGITIDFRLGGFSAKDQNTDVSQSFSADFCVNWFQNFAVPLHNVVDNAWFFKSNQWPPSAILQGDAHCVAHSKCLRNTTLNEINQLCHSCQGSKEWCQLIIHFL